MLCGCAVGLVIGLALIPAAVFGPQQTWAYYREWQEVLIQPGLTGGGNQSRAKELIEVTATDTQSFMSLIHTAVHLDRGKRPRIVAGPIRNAHWGLAAVLTLFTLLAAGRRKADDPIATVLLLSALTVMMMLTSPVCHLHYFSLLLPLTAGLLAASWERRRTAVNSASLGAGIALLLSLNIVCNAVPRFPNMELVRELGMAAYATLFLWLAACVVLWRRRRYNIDIAR
jgi:hypothetical protein